MYIYIAKNFIGNIEKNKFRCFFQYKSKLLSKALAFSETLSGKKENIAETFNKVMMRISIIKLAVAMATLIVMTILLFLNLDAIAPVTSQFSKWVSSPLIGFIILIVITKFVGISVGLTLTIMAAKNVTFEELRLGLKEYCWRRLCVFLTRVLFRRKGQPQIN